MNVRDINHAAMQWHAVHARRMALNAERLRLTKERTSTPAHIRVHPNTARYWAVKEEITAIKAKERAALKLLAKACAAQRTELANADVIDVDVLEIEHSRDAFFSEPEQRREDRLNPSDLAEKNYKTN